MMKKVILYEPSIGSNNLGDQIIVDAVKTALKDYLNDAFIIELPTHTPLSNRYLHYLGKADLRIVCGSNIIVGRLNSVLHLRQWMVGNSISSIGPLVMVGVGAQQYGQKISMYSQWAYKKMMRKDFIHSVRDSYTEETFNNIGINNVINTGCPTMWGLTERHCQKIPVNKADKCIFTLTDYKKNIERDTYLIKTLKNNYQELYFWPQGNGDWKYLTELTDSSFIKIIPPNLDDYTAFLEKNDTDFVGTRLHGGIRALQKCKRSLIIGIDNRAIELNKNFAIPVLDEKQITELEECINSEWCTSVKLPEANIKKFLRQF